MRTILRSALAAGVLLASLAAIPGRAQQVAERSATRAELTAAGGANLYEAIARVRPEWLLLAGDDSDPASRDRVLVFVDGRHVGTVEALRTLSVDAVASVRLRTEAYVRRTMPRFPRQDFTAALFVATRTAPRDLAAQGRWSVRLRGGVQMISQASGTSTAYEDEGFDDVPRDPSHNFSNPGSNTPPLAGASVRYALRERLGVELEVQHTFDGWMSGLDYARGAFNATMNSTEAALLASYGSHPFRLGVGPAFRQTRWTYYDGFTRTVEGSDHSTSGVGAAASLSITLPARGRTFGEFNLRAATFSEDTPSFGSVPAVSAGRTAISASFGFGTGF